MKDKELSPPRAVLFTIILHIAIMMASLRIIGLIAPRFLDPCERLVNPLCLMNILFLCALIGALVYLAIYLIMLSMRGKIHTTEDWDRLRNTGWISAFASAASITGKPVIYMFVENGEKCMKLLEANDGNSVSTNAIVLSLIGLFFFMAAGKLALTYTEKHSGRISELATVFAFMLEMVIVYFIF